MNGSTAALLYVDSDSGSFSARLDCSCAQHSFALELFSESPRASPSQRSEHFAWLLAMGLASFHPSATRSPAHLFLFNGALFDSLADVRRSAARTRSLSVSSEQQLAACWRRLVLLRREFGASLSLSDVLQFADALRLPAELVRIELAADRTAIEVPYACGLDAPPLSTRSDAESVSFRALPDERSSNAPDTSLSSASASTATGRATPLHYNGMPFSRKLEQMEQIDAQRPTWTSLLRGIAHLRAAIAAGSAYAPRDDAGVRLTEHAAAAGVRRLRRSASAPAPNSEQQDYESDTGAENEGAFNEVDFNISVNGPLCYTVTVGRRHCSVFNSVRLM